MPIGRGGGIDSLSRAWTPPTPSLGEPAPEETLHPSVSEPTPAVEPSTLSSPDGWLIPS